MLKAVICVNTKPRVSRTVRQDKGLTENLKDLQSNSSKLSF
jgi:hypothetical protein